MNTIRTGTAKGLWIRLTQITGLDHLRIRCRVEDLHSVLLVASTDSDVFGTDGRADVRSVSIRLPQDDLFGIGRPSMLVDQDAFRRTLVDLTRQAEIQTEKDRRAGWTIDAAAEVWVTFEVLSGADSGLHLTLEMVERLHSKVS